MWALIQAQTATNSLRMVLRKIRIGSKIELGQ